MALSASDPSPSPVGAPPGGQARPLIGITTYLERAQTGVWDVQASFLPKVYLDGVTDAGGIAILLPPQPVDAGVAEAVIASLDGLIVAGGADVDPALYGQEAHPATGAPRADRDTWEMALLQAASDADLPYLGICRGAQMMNVARGGTLHQHVPDLVHHPEYQPGEGIFGSVDVQVASGTRLAGVVGQELAVPVYHHQSIDQLGAGLRVSASTAEGVIEAVEDPNSYYAVGVQWHPEEAAADRRLFLSLVQAAHEAKQRKAQSA